jgi:hypothetical protein
MRFALKAVSAVVVIGGLGVLGFAVFSDLPAPTREVSLPVEVQ